MLKTHIILPSLSVERYNLPNLSRWVVLLVACISSRDTRHNSTGDKRW